MEHKKRTKIVATIGPGCDDQETLEMMIAAGMDVARFNFSHDSQESHGLRIQKVRKAASRVGKRVGIMLDNRGPEIRLGVFEKGAAQLREGETFFLRTYDVMGSSREANVSLIDLPRIVKKGSHILLDDGIIGLRVVNSADDSVETVVENSGVIKDRKNVSIPGHRINLPAASEKDKKDLAFGASLHVDFIAASFVRTKDDVREIRELLREFRSQAAIISKIESTEGVENLSEIIEESDGIMVARGDLGVQYPVEEIPILQKRIIRECLRAGKPVITATEMLESMIDSPRPTRAETSDVANAIFDGTDAVMLSAETANGKHPVEAVKVMAKIAARAEEVFKPPIFRGGLREIDEAVSHSAVNAADDLEASAIVTPTVTGYTARMVSRFRPATPIYAVTPLEDTVGFLTVVWGVTPVKAEKTSSDSSEDLEVLLKQNLLGKGDLCVVTRGVPFGVAGTTNSMEIRVLE